MVMFLASAILVSEKRETHLKRDSTRYEGTNIRFMRWGFVALILAMGGVAHAATEVRSSSDATRFSLSRVYNRG